jgi:hypothetical protein
VRIVYAPTDGDKHEWTWKPREMDSFEVEALEESSGWDYPEFLQRFMAGSTRARRSLLWVLLRRDHPRLRFEQVRFTYAELLDEFDDEEVAAAQAVLEAQPTNEDDPLDDAARQRLAERLAADSGVEPGKDTGADAAPTSGI